MTVTSQNVRVSHPERLETGAFEALFLQHHAFVYRVLFRLVGERAEAEDLTLETFWRLWQQPPRVTDNVAGWLYRVATHLGYNALRAARRRDRYEEETARESLETAPVRDPGREAERAEERALVRETLGRMSERDAQLLVLRYSGFSYKEIAAALGVSPNSVGTLLTRAEQEFEKRFG